MFNIPLSQNPPDWAEILTHFRGSELQNYFTKLLEDNLKPCIKPQNVDQLRKAVKGTVQELLDKKDDHKIQDEICVQFGMCRVCLVGQLQFVMASTCVYFGTDLDKVRHRNIDDLSGGELQRFACAIVCIQFADVYVISVL